MIAELNKMHQISLFWRKNKMLLMSQQLNSKAAFKSFDKRQFRQVYHTL